MASEEVKFKVSLVYLVPILASLVFGLGCAWLLSPHQSSDPNQVIPDIPIVPFPDDVTGAAANGLYIVSLVALGATLCYIMLKRNNLKIIKVVISLVMTMASMLLSLVYVSTIFSHFNFHNDFLVIVTSILITAVFDLIIFKFVKYQSVAIICIGGALGVFFSFLIPLYSTIVILVFLSVYDIFAVYRGPVGKIAQAGLDHFPGLSYAFKDIQMGLGDLVFYAVLMGTMYFSFSNSILPAVMSLAGICIGVVITFVMLEKKEVFPGLPFPIALGLTLGLTTTVFI
ncbi:MAG: presenilin [Candidatus Bathyarchaeota archaeon]|nr:presenilin [Candidatus Termiticorpusculum sp.]